MIDIVSLLLVAGASIVGTAAFVALCAFGLRLLVAHGRPRSVASGEVRGENTVSPGRSPVPARPLLATIGAYTCFVLCAGCVALAVYLIVPVWHR